jgi:penicillin-binding protein 1A
VGLALGFIILVLTLKGVLGEMPGFEDLENPRSNLATEIISSDGQVIGKFYLQNRSYTKFHEISPHVISALIATEDARFYSHSGIDLRALARAVVFMGREGGASTITQQLALNLFSGKRAGSKPARVLQKIKEWIIAVQLEKRYTKQEILAMYLNTVEFGYNSFGISSASRTYFDKDVKALDVHEAAMLVGLLKGTSYYSPVRHQDRALDRRNTVISQMVKYGFLEPQVGERYQALPLSLNLRPQSHAAGTATYFREYLRKELSHWIESQVNPEGKPYNLYRDGFKIYTTIDSRMQLYAEEAVRSQMKDLQKAFDQHWRGQDPWGDFTEILDHGMKRSTRYQALKEQGWSASAIRRHFDQPAEIRLFSWNGYRDTVMTPMDSIRYAKRFLHTGFMAMDPHNGHIKAWVGGIDMDFSQYDHVNPSARRQAGSTFKPVVYTVAVDNGFDPCLPIPNMPVTFEAFDNWTPKNYDGKIGGTMSMFRGLALSINNIVAYLMKQVGPEPVIELSRKMGISSPMEPYPSLCLGSFDMSVYEMVGAYGTYANRGVWTKPMYITKISDRQGNIMLENFSETKDVLSEETAFVMTKLLQKVVDGGTASRLRYRYNLSGELAGKTGTTQNNSDGWFIGFHPDLVAGAWVGADDRAVHFRSTSLGGGANTALPIFGLFMKKVMADSRLNIKPASFTAPDGGISINMDCSGYAYEKAEDEDNWGDPSD